MVIAILILAFLVMGILVSFLDWLFNTPVKKSARKKPVYKCKIKF